MPKSDSSVIVSFNAPDGNGIETVYNVVITDPPAGKKITITSEEFIVPAAIILIIAAAITFASLKIKAGSGLDKFLEKIDSKIPRFFKF